MAPTTVPAALKEGDTIAFISPSERLNSIFPAALNRAKIYIDSLGFKVKIIFDPTPSSNFREAVLKRCDEVHAAFRDPEVKAILCTVGGTTANELLRFLDYDLIKANPKIFCGYSDITVLHYAIFTQTGLQTFYGATAIAEFGEFPEPLDFTAKDFLKVLKDSADRPIGLVPRSLEWTQDLPGFFFGKDTKGPRNLDPAPGWTWLRAGKAKGRIFGGCLSVVLRLKGTKYWADHRGKILLLENPMGEQIDGPLSLQRTRSFMADLANMDLFDQITGLVIGRPFAYDETMREEFGKMVLDQCYGTDFPILTNVDVGHTDPILTIPLNAMCSLDSETDSWEILEPGVTS